MPWSTDLEHDEKFCQKTHYFFKKEYPYKIFKKKNSKHAAFFSVEVWCFFSFPLGFGNVGQKLQKLWKNLLQCCLHIALLFWHPIHYTKPKKNMSMEVHDCLRHSGVLSFVFFIFPWMPKQKSKVQTAFKKSIVFNGFANEAMKHIYPPTPALAKAGAAPGTTAGVELLLLR